MYLHCIDSHTLLASSFSFADFICLVLVTSSRSIFSFHLNANSALIPFSRMNSAKSRLVKLFHFFEAPQEDFLSADFLFAAEAAQNSAIDLFFERQVSKALVGFFHCELTLGHFYKHHCMQTNRNNVFP